MGAVAGALADAVVGATSIMMADAAVGPTSIMMGVVAAGVVGLAGSAGVGRTAAAGRRHHVIASKILTGEVVTKAEGDSETGAEAGATAAVAVPRNPDPGGTAVAGAGAPAGAGAGAGAGLLEAGALAPVGATTGTASLHRERLAAAGCRDSTPRCRSPLRPPVFRNRTLLAGCQDLMRPSPLFPRLVALLQSQSPLSWDLTPPSPARCRRCPPDTATGRSPEASSAIDRGERTESLGGRPTTRLEAVVYNGKS